MNPNHETTINILNQKLANANLEAAQWQSVANDLRKENEQYKQESVHLNEQINELNLELGGKPYEVTRK